MPGMESGFEASQNNRPWRGWLLLVGCAVALLAALGAYRVVDDPDLFWHLKVGEQILAEHAVPTTDRYSYTFEGRPFPIVDWAAEATMAWLHLRFGAGGLFAMAALLAAATMLLVALRMRAASERHSPTLAALFLLLVYAVATFRFTPRPQTFLWVCLGVLLALLERARDNRALAPVWLVPPLAVVWANLHSSSILALVFLGAFVTGELWTERAHVRPRLAKTWRALLGLGLLSIAACFVVPHAGGRLHATFAAFFSPYSTSVLSEWQPTTLDQWLAPSGLLLVLTTMGLVLDRRRTHASEVLAFAVAAWLGFRHIRFLPILALVGAPLAYRHWLNLLFRRSRPGDGGAPPRWTRIWARVDGWSAVAMIAGFAWATMLADSRSPWLGGLGKPHADFAGMAYPVGATDFLARERPGGHMYNTFHFGGYLLYRLGPEVKVFVDGRTSNVYDDAHMRDVMEIRSRWRHTFARWDIQYAVVQHGEIEDQLAADPRWSLVYLDDAALVFVRKDGVNAALAGRLAYRALRPPFARPPADEAERTLFVEECERAVREAPRSALARILRGRARAATGDVPGFEADMHEARTLDPTRAEPWIRLGLLAFGRGRMLEAAESLARAAVLERNPNVFGMQRAAANLALGNRSAALEHSAPSGQRRSRHRGSSVDSDRAGVRGRKQALATG